MTSTIFFPASVHSSGGHRVGQAKAGTYNYRMAEDFSRTMPTKSYVQGMPSQQLGAGFKHELSTLCGDTCHGLQNHTDTPNTIDILRATLCRVYPIQA